jgi:cation diffusion facilitator CzcD-associated flavoprotein CzcO
MSTTDTRDTYAVIGAGPSGLAAARNLQKLGLRFTGFETYADVGGLWNIANPRSTVYESAHLISSKRMTEFAEFPMADSVADYPSHCELCGYFRDYADHFGLREHYRFNARVLQVEPVGDGTAPLWRVRWSEGEGGEAREALFKGVIIANGTLAEPNMPRFEGKFEGELLHTSAYKSAALFEGKRVLIVGAGNSGCDIAVDAVHRAAKVDN